MRRTVFISRIKSINTLIRTVHATYLKKKTTNNDKFKHKVYKIEVYNNKNSDEELFSPRFEQINIII